MVREDGEYKAADHGCPAPRRLEDKHRVWLRDKQGGSNFTIRKFSDTPISITQLIKWGTISSLGAAYIWMLLENNLNVWFVGETASGKTTLLRAACAFIRPTAKIISIEDVPEIVVPHENWVSEVTRHGQEGSDSVELFDLLKASLRQRPNYIIVGEIRGREASIAFQTMQYVEDAYVATERGAILLSELFGQLRHEAQRDGDGRQIAHLPEPLIVYATSPGRLGVEARLCTAIIKIPLAERISVRMSDGGRIVVTPNHRFIVEEEGHEREVEAREVLEAWRRGARWVRLSKRPPPGKGEGWGEAEHVYRLPSSSLDFWWAMGRLLGGDYIAERGGRYYWHAKLGSREDYLRLRRILEMTCWKGRDLLSARGRRLRAVLGPINPPLIHWAMMRGLLVPLNGRLVGSARGLGEELLLPYLSGMMSAASGGSYIYLNGNRGIDTLVEVLNSLRGMGVAGAAKVVIHCSPDRLGELGRLDRLLEGFDKRLYVKRGARGRISVRVYPNLLAPLMDGGGEGSALRDEVLRYILVEEGEAEKTAVELWLDGVPTAVFKEGRRAYVYLDSPLTCWVTGIEEAGRGPVYDLVLEGGGYYIGGLCSAMPIQDTGAGVISTFHAGSVAKIIQRLTGEPIEIPKTFIDNLNAVVIQSAVRSPETGRLERRVLSINELVGIDEERGAVNYIELFRWDPRTDSHEFRGEGNSYILEEKIATIYGLSRRELKKIYQELNRRSKFLELLIERGVLDYKQVYGLITTVYKVGIEAAMDVVLEGQ